MHGISAYMYHKNQPNVGKYTSPMDGMGKVWNDLWGNGNQLTLGASIDMEGNV